MIKPEKIIKIFFPDRFQGVFILLIVLLIAGLYLEKSETVSLNTGSNLLKFFEQNPVEWKGIPDVHTTRRFYLLAQILKDIDFLRCDRLLPDKQCNMENSSRRFQEGTFPFNQKKGILPDISPIPYHNLKSLIIKPGNNDENRDIVSAISLYTGSESSQVLFNLLNFLKNNCEAAIFNQWILVENELHLQHYERNFKYIISGGAKKISIGLNNKPTTELRKKISFFLDYIDQPDGINSIAKKGLWCR
jgi:hypothetical protein